MQAADTCSDVSACPGEPHHRDCVRPAGNVGRCARRWRRRRVRALLNRSRRLPASAPRHTV